MLFSDGRTTVTLALFSFLFLLVAIIDHHYIFGI